MARNIICVWKICSHPLKKMNQISKSPSKDLTPIEKKKKIEKFLKVMRDRHIGTKTNVGFPY